MGEKDKEEKLNLAVASETLRDVILSRKKSGDTKDVILGVHRLNQVLSKAETYAKAEELCISLCTGDAGAMLLQVLVDIVVTGAPETYPVLCLLHTLALFRDTSAALVRLQIPFILSALLKGRIEEVTGDMARKVLETIHKQNQS